jgi:uracil-DNA glycosylase
MTHQSHPCANGDRKYLAAKLDRLENSHTAPLTEFVRQMRAETGGEIPWFDPDMGGVRARALFLLEAPGARATSTSGPRSSSRGSGVISPDNNDQTAANSWDLYRKADLDQNLVTVWNIVPWYLGTTTKIRTAGRSDIDAARPYLHRLVQLLPDLRVVLTIGKPARDGWKRYALTEQAPKLQALACPHPSPQNLNTRPEARDQILTALRQVQSMIE